MRATYRAILRGDRVEWLGQSPALTAGEGLSVEITVVGGTTSPDVTVAGTALAAGLEELSKRNPFSAIEDPVAWQREQRADRPLPGREG